MHRRRPTEHHAHEALTALQRSEGQVERSRWPQRNVTQKAFATDSSIQGSGIIARERIAKGEIVLVYGGVIVPKGEIMEYTDTLSVLGIQVNDDFFICPGTKEDTKIGGLNHSCDPNCGFTNSVTVAAIRDIEPGEELTIDYAMMESYRFNFKCMCGSENCRGMLTPEDWKIPELQGRYSGYFSPYLQEKINSMNLE